MRQRAPFLAPLALLALLVLGSCGGGGGEATPEPPAGPAPETIGVFTGFKDGGDLNWESTGGDGTGGVGDGGADGDGGVGAGGDFGQFRGANVCVFLDNGTQLGCALSDNLKGMVTIKPGLAYRGGLRIELSGTPTATYYEEGRDVYVPFPADRKIRVWVPFINRNIGITPFTEAAYRLLTEGSAPESVGNAAPTKDQIRAANERVRLALNEHFPTALHVDDIARLPFIKSQGLPAGSMRTDPRGRYGLVNGAFSKQASFHNSDSTTPTLDAVRQLAEDLLDGRIDGRNGDQPAGLPGARTYDPNTLTGELSSALAEQATRFGAQEALDVLPKVLNFGNVRYEGYLFDGSISKAGNAHSTVAGWVAGNSRNLSPGDRFDRLPGQRALALYGNNGHGGGFYKADALGPRHKVYAIGDNVNGELGLGTRDSTRGAAVEIPLPGGMTHAVGGFAHTVMRLANGQVFAWGDNTYGQLGQGQGPATLPSSLTPLRVDLPRPALAVASANIASYALLDDGTVWAWGHNGGFGLLGNGTRTGMVATPTAVTGLTQIVQISARDNDVVALRRDHTLWHWGSFPADESAFDAGDPSAAYRGGTLGPQQVQGLPAGVPVRKVLTEQGLFAALLANGHVYHWGVHFDITAGQVLRDLEARRVLGLPPLRDIMPGGFVGYGARPFDRLTATGVDYRGGMWKVRGRVGEVFDPDNPSAQRRPQGQGPRVDCQACHTPLDEALEDILRASRQPTTGAPVCEPPIATHRGLAGTLIHAETECAQCHNPSRLNYPVSTPSGNMPFANNNGWPDCVKPGNLPNRGGIAPPVLTNSCTIPANHVFTPPGTVCASCHNSVIARPLNDASLACAQPLSSELPTIPTQATIAGAFDDAGGTIAAGGLSSDRTPELRGALSAPLLAGQSLAILRNGSVVGTATVGGSGAAWTFTDSAPDGSHSYGARVVNGTAFGPPSNTLAFAIDATPPAISAPVGNFFDDVIGTVAIGGFLSDSTPRVDGTLTGALAAGETVRVLRNGSVVGTATVGAGGASWSFVEPAALAAGTFSYQGRVVDAAGNLGALSGAAQVTLVSAVPTVSITQALNDATNRVIADGGATNDATPVFSGTLSAAMPTGYVLIVLRDGVARGNATLGAGRNTWTFAEPGSADGTFAYTARVDAGAVQGATSAAYTVTVDTVAPTQQASVVSIADDVNGVLAGANPTTPDTTPTVNGTITAALGPGDQVQLLRNGAAVATLPAFVGTSWSYTEPTPVPIPGGASQVTLTYAARVIDTAGQLSTAAPGTTRQVTVSPGSVPLQNALTTITSVAGIAVPGGGAVVSPNYNTTPVIAGSLQRALLADEVVAIYRNTTSPVVPGSRGGTAALVGTLAQATLGASTTFNFASSALSPGSTYYFSANIEKAANALLYGAPSATSGTPVITAPSITVSGIFDDASVSVGGGNTADATPRVSGTLGRSLLSGETLQLRRTLGGTTTSFTVVPTGTSWTFTEPGALAVGLYSYQLRTLDAAGNPSGLTAALTVNVIATLPSASSIGGPVANDGFVSDATPTVSGTLGATLPTGASVRVYRATGANLCTTLGSVACPLVGTVGTVGSAAWSFTDANVGQGQRRYRVRVENGTAYGTTSSEYRLNVDTLAPTQTYGALSATTSVMPNTTVTGAVPNGNTIASGGRTNDNSPTLRIPLNSALGAGETLRIKRGGATVVSSTLGSSCGSNCFLVSLPSPVTLTNNEFGSLSLTPPSSAGLPTAQQAYTVVVVDQAGNEGAPSAAFNISFGYHDCDLARANATHRTFNAGADHTSWTGATCSSCHTQNNSTTPTTAGTLVAVPAGISFPSAPSTSYWCRRP